MNRRSVLSVSAIAVLGLALLPATAFSQQKSLKEQIVGRMYQPSTSSRTGRRPTRLGLTQKAC